MSACPRPTDPATRPWRWLRRPCWPCVLLPAGQAGILEIGARAYQVIPLGEYPSRGFRVTSDRGDCYDIDTQAAHGWQCDCPDATFRPERPGGCKHVQTLRLAIESLFVDAPATVDAIDLDALARGEELASPYGCLGY